MSTTGGEIVTLAQLKEEEEGWSDPQPLVAKTEPEPYPLDALPSKLRAAVEEVLGFTQAPTAMVASSALGALSLAAQAHADVMRAEMLSGPTGLFLLTIADSGERKSTCDGFFMKAIREYEAEQQEAAEPLVRDYMADKEAWEAKRSGVKDKIRQESKGGKQTTVLENKLREIECEKPKPPLVPRLIYSDATPEALKWNLAKGWPSGGVISSEGGLVFGSHGMGKDSVMRNLSTLNQLWDGSPISTERRTSESFTVQGARLTIHLQVQEPTLREFFGKSGQLARGTGFLARFLVAWPESTQGSRFFSDPPAAWPALSQFNQRISQILAMDAPINERDELMPQVLSLSPEAKEAWVIFHNGIEHELSPNRELCDVRDVASKTADNAVRLAALFHLFEGGVGAVGLDAFDGASDIALWHLSEARRFYGELALPEELADAVRLDSWVIKYCRQEGTHIVGKNHIRRFGPLRDGARLNTAINELSELDRLRLKKVGKRMDIYVNPAILERAIQ